MFTLIADIAKSTNDLLYFMNRFHSDVYCMFELIYVGARIKRKHNVYWNTIGKL